jgi:hypothetical protein
MSKIWNWGILATGRIAGKFATELQELIFFVKKEH